ncbi:MAG: AAA family ATPase [Balneolaceae bacterium]
MSTSTFNKLSYNAPEVNSFIEELKQVNVDSSYYLLLLVGPYRKGKKQFLENLADRAGQSITHIDLHDIVTMYEDETYENIDSLFQELHKEESILFFSNGDRLCGAYTGYTYSKTRYATPQEKYFLKKIQKLEKIILLDILDEDNVDKTLERNSHFTLSFNKPTSILKRFTWSLGNYSFHGHQIVSKRPQRKT